ncbi:sunset domain-containing protein [Lacticaseibacillus suihuaensis]
MKRHTLRRSGLVGLLIAALVATGTGCAASSTAPEPPRITQAAKTEAAKQHRTKVALTAALAEKQAKADKLNKEKEALAAEQEKRDEAAAKASSVAQAKADQLAKEKEAAAAKAKAAAAASQAKAAASSRAASSARVAAANRAATSRKATGGSRKQGNLDTGAAKTIVGNVNSKIYHVPGQASYRMNSANAVYFATEAEAQAAGYRKAKR